MYRHLFKWPRATLLANTIKLRGVSVTRVLGFKRSPRIQFHFSTPTTHFGDRVLNGRCSSHRPSALPVCHELSPERVDRYGVLLLLRQTFSFIVYPQPA